MTATEFAAWMQWRGLDDKAAASLLAASRPEVSKWRRGVRAVPGKVARIVDLLDEVERLTNALATCRQLATD